MIPGKVGNVTVVTTSNGGHSPEFYAERIVARLISVSDSAPDPIKQQALMYKDSLHRVVLDGLKRSLLSDRANLIMELQRRGMDEAAAIVQTQGIGG